jgi:hypothetical protein
MPIATPGRLNLSSQFCPFGLFDSAFISMPAGPFMDPEGGAAAGGIVLVPGHGFPVVAAPVCVPVVPGVVVLVFGFGGVLGVVGAGEAGVVPVGEVVVPVAGFVAPVGWVVVFVHCAGVVFVVAGGGFCGLVVCATAGAANAAIKPPAQAKPRTLAPRFMPFVLSSHSN